MKYYHPLKAALFLCLALLAIPLFAETTTPPSNTNNNVDNKAADLATKTVNLIEDTATTAYIYAQIALDKNLSNLNINVSTDRGKVRLEGAVNSRTEANAVIKLAYSASGVTAVDASKLRVSKSNQPFTDMMITAKVKSSVIYNKVFNKASMPADLKIETKNGIVYLSGKADSATQIQDAVRLAAAVSGVSGVESFIKLTSQDH